MSELAIFEGEKAVKAEEFEKELANWHEMKYGLACNNGTAAIHSALFSLKSGLVDISFTADD